MSRTVKLVPMTQGEFERYLDGAIREYAADHVQAGNWSEAESVEKSRGEFQTLLPEGVASVGQYLYSIVDAVTGQAVGMGVDSALRSEGCRANSAHLFSNALPKHLAMINRFISFVKLFTN